MELKMKTIRAAVVGVGYLGKFHAEKYARMEGVQLIGVVDGDPIRAKEVAKIYQTQAYTDYRQLLGRVDAVSIAVPTPYHFQISKDLLLNNIDVLIEKPITISLEEADELVRLADQKGLIIQVGHLERFNPAVVALENKITTPRFIESHRLSTFKERGTDVSVVLDLMIHDIDIILNLVRSDLTQIHAAGIPVITNQVDIANARLTFANGCVANVTASRISTKNERKIRLFQQNAYISVDFANHAIDIICKDPNHKNGIIPGMQVNHLSFTHGDALDDELKSFINSVRNRTQAEVTGQMGRDALKIALSIMDQIQVNSAQLFHQEAYAV
jgi:predicted dehydrogenase